MKTDQMDPREKQAIEAGERLADAHIEQLTRRAVAAERERCATIAESFETGYVGEYYVKAVEQDARTRIAARIRSGE